MKKPSDPVTQPLVTECGPKLSSEKFQMVEVVAFR